MMIVFNILLGVLVVVLLTVATGYFVAQEFGYMAVDRSRLKAQAADGDTGAKRALGITRRTSFMLSGAQLGITVTGLLVGYVAEPLIGDSLGELLGGVGIPHGAGIAIGTVSALLLSTVVQMVFGELVPKNLAIAKPEPVARWLALSTDIYLKLFGWLIRLFDQASNLLLKLLRIKPVHDVEHAATPRDLEHIVAESRQSGDLPAELSTLLERTLDLHERTAEHAMIPRPLVTTVSGHEPVGTAIELMASGHSRLPVLGSDVDDVIGMICLRDVLALEGKEVLVREAARDTVMVPASLPLPAVVSQLRQAGEQFACVADEYGGLAGVITLEDVAEELVGEITDEHDQEEAARPAGEGWLISGTTHIDEVERLIGHVLSEGAYETIAGLVITELQRLAEPDDTIAIRLPSHDDEPDQHLTVRVRSVARRVPETVLLTLQEVRQVAK